MAKIDINLVVNDKGGLNETFKKFNDEAKKAQATTDNLGDSLKKTTSVSGTLTTSLSGVLTPLLGIVAAVKGIGALADFFGDAVQAASEQEVAIAKLNASLALTGDFTKEASQDFQDFASALQTTTKFADDAILNGVSLAKTFGATNEQAKAIVQTATNLSAALGQDLETSVRQVGQTLSGTSGRLGLVVGDLKNLTAEQLKTGEGIKVLQQRFAGLAQSELNTFQGALTSTRNIFGDLLEEFGNLIIKNPLVIRAIQLVGQIFTQLINIIAENRQGIIDFINRGILILVDAFSGLGKTIVGLRQLYISLQDAGDFVFQGITYLIQGVLSLGKAYTTAYASVARFLGLDSGAEFFEKQNKAIEEQIQSLKTLRKVSEEEVKERNDNQLKFAQTVEQTSTAIVRSVNDATKASSDSVKTLEDLAKTQKPKVDQELAAQFSSIQQAFKKESLDTVEALRKQQNEQLAVVKKAVSEGLATEKDAQELRVKINKDASTKIQKLVTEEKKKFEEGAKAVNQFTDELKKIAQTGLTNPFVNIDQDIEEAKKKLKDFNLSDDQKKRIELEIEAAVNLTALNKAAGLITQIGKGAQGAQSFLSQAVGSFANTFLPGIGGAASQIFDVFSQGPDAVRAQVRAFTSAIPELIKNFILAIPAFIDELGKQLPILITTLAQNTGPIISALAAQMPQVAIALAVSLIREAPNIALAIIKGLVPGFDLFNLKLDTGITNFISKFLGFGDFLKNGIQSVFEFFSSGLKAVFQGVIGEFFNFAVSSISKIWEFFVNIGGTIVSRIWDTFLSFGGSIISRVWDVFISFAGSTIAKIFDLFLGFGSGTVAKVFQTFFDFGVGTVVRIFQTFLDFGVATIARFFGSFIEYGLTALNEIIKNIPVVGGVLGGGGGGNLIDQGGDVLEDLNPFARGGLVPDRPEFRNDRFPARLSAGELVIPRELTQRLDSFLSNTTSGVTQDSNQGLLISILDKLSQPVVVESQVALNDQAFATVLQTLNRSNKRIA